MNDFITRAGADAEEVDAFRQLIEQFHSAWESALEGKEPPRLDLFVARLPQLDQQAQLRDQLLEIDGRYQQMLSSEGRSSRTTTPTETIAIAAPASQSSAEPNRTLAATIDPDSRASEATTDGFTSLRSDLSMQSEYDLSGIDETIPPNEVERTTDFSLDAAVVAAEKPSGTKSARAFPKVPGYEILGELGRGGMGVVYRAKQLGLNRHVALKMILAGNHAAPQQLVRFRAEAEAVAQLQHGNIVQIYDVGEQEGLPFFSLEFIGGGALDQLIKEKPLIPQQAASIVETIARAMHYAHQRNIVHRDLKPANILLTNDGQPKITDFGLVKRLEDEASQTRTGTVMGTPSYMAPEQARGDKEVGPLADVYALGSILYCLLTGRPPFMAASAIDTVMQVLKEEPVPPRRIQPKIPVDLDTICLKCLQKEPAKRYGSALELAEDLHRFLSGAPILARPVGVPERIWRLCKRNPRIAIPSALAAIFALVLMIGGPAAAISIYQKSRAETKAKNLAQFHARVADTQTKEAERQAHIAREKSVQAEESAKAAEQSAQAAIASADVANQQRNLALDTLRSLVERVQPLLQDTPRMQQVRQDLLNVALGGLQEVAQRSDGIQDSSVLMAGARRRMGELFLELGQTERALSEFKRCHQIVIDLDKAGKLPNASANLATSFENLGLASKRGGDLNEAKKNLEIALEYRSKYYEESQKSLRAMDDLARTLGVIGSICNELGQHEEAIKYYLASMQLRQEDVNAHPGEDRPQQELAGAMSAVGELYLKMGDQDRAVSMLEDSVEQLRGIASRHDDRKAYWNQYLFEMRLASLKLMLGDVTTAHSTFQEVNANFVRMSLEDPENATLKMHLSQSYYGLGVIQDELGEKAAAKSSYEQSLELRRRLASDDPTNVTKQAALMLSLARYGEINEAAKCADGIKNSARNASAYYLAATGYAVCAGKLKEDSSLTGGAAGLADEYTAKAITALEEATRRGYQFSQEQRLDPDLRPLHGHPAFEALFPPQ